MRLKALSASAMHSGGSKGMAERQAAIASALRTVTTEQAGMAALAEALLGGLAEPFARAVEVLSALHGRAIVTGVGKSHHIGSKIAATLASTGTPAYFVHPSEANHGDLGMITKDDVIIGLSWSGESLELKGIVSYARRFSIPLIAITAGETSALAREADMVLCMPKVTEACPHGLAPTTSTLLQLAIGDALAVALLEARGFTADHFRSFHPGGQLGANLTHVGEIMHSGDEMPVVPLGTKMPEAVMVLSRKRFGCVCVIDGEGQLVGIVTDGDLARNLHRNMSELAVDDIMTRQPKTVKRQTIAGAAMGLLNDHHISALIVVDGDMPVGIVHFHDLLRIGAA
jgi:arabinose-5-phosphate isomerase